MLQRATSYRKTVHLINLRRIEMLRIQKLGKIRTFKEPMRISITGPQGCGKTAIANCIAGILALAKYRVTIDGSPSYAGAPGLKSGTVFIKTSNTMRPKVVCLCGSTRFYKEFQKANYEETMEGNIVLSVGFYPHASEEMHGEKIGITPEQKTALDELHKRKIDMANEILVLNVGGYIGDSTAGEIEYAMRLNKTVRYLENKATYILHSQVGKTEDMVNSVVDMMNGSI
jgi:energy-coupling factor transporter ATP-binding protein EcfA2